MPDGRIHNAFSIVLSIPTGLLVMNATGQSDLALAAAGGCLLGMILSPDLDRNEPTVTEKFLVKWTLGGFYLFVALFYPYAAVLPHRHWLSHFPLISTAIRLGYLFLITSLALSALGYALVLDAYGPYLFWIAIGLAISDAAHWLADQTIRLDHQHCRHW